MPSLVGRRDRRRRPKVIVALGAVAARALLGRTVGIAASRGTPFDVEGTPVFVTYHPSAVLRADERAKEIRAALIEDLIAARDAAGVAAVGVDPERRPAVCAPGRAGTDSANAE